jgi:hypothetical protein
MRLIPSFVDTTGRESVLEDLDEAEASDDIEADAPVAKENRWLWSRNLNDAMPRFLHRRD